MKRLVRNLLVLIAVAIACTAGLWMVGWLVRPNLTEQQKHTPQEIADAEKARDVHFDPKHTPTYHLDTHVAPKNESPILAELVNEGVIPPLKDRMPEDPIVMEG